MKKLIDKYLDIALGNYSTVLLQDADYDIQEEGYYTNVEITKEADSYQAKIKGRLSENYVTFSIQETSDIDQDHKYNRKTFVDFFRKEDHIHFEKIAEDRINLYDFDNCLIRSKLERKTIEMDNFPISIEDQRKDLLDDIKMIKKTHVLKKK